MKKIIQALLVTSAFVATANAATTSNAVAPAPVAAQASANQTVYVNGKAVPKAVIDKAMAEVMKNPQFAQQLTQNPTLKGQILQSIGLQQAILLKGDAEKLGSSKAYQDKLTELKPMIYAQIMQANIEAQPVTQAQIDAKYKEMSATVKGSQEYLVEHILVSNQQEANDIVAQLKKGAKFEDLAKQKSSDKGSAVNGGSLGWSNGAQFVPEFTQAVKQLKKGQYTVIPVKTQFGYHIIKLVDVRSTQVPPLAQVKNQITQEIKQERLKNFFDGIKTQYKIEVK